MSRSRGRAHGPQRRRARQSARGLDRRGADQLVAQLDAAMERTAAERALANGQAHADMSEGERRNLVYVVITPHARHQRRGGVEIDKLARCHASEREQRGGASLGPEGKVIYDSIIDAEHAAAALERAGLGRVYPYPCGRSRSGHAHLTSSPPSTWPPRLRGLAAAARRRHVEHQLGRLR